MKKIFLSLLLMLSVSCLAGENSSTVQNSNMVDATVEQVNDSTVVYRNIERLEIYQAETNIIYVYDLKSSKLISVNRGYFSISLAKGDYMIVSTTPFTKAKTEAISENTQAFLY